MKVLSVTKVARNFSRTIDMVEKQQQEIVLIRNGKQVARIVPEPAGQTALEICGDLYRTLDDKTAETIATALVKARNSCRGRLSELRNPWIG